MRVLITHELFPPDVHGGGELVVYKIAKLLQEKGVEIKVVTTGDPKIKSYDGIETIRLPIHRYMMNFTAPIIARYARWADLIHTNNYNACFPSFLAAKMVKKPIICHIHEVYGKKWLKMRGIIAGNLSRVIERFQIRHRFDKFIFFSKHMQQFALRLGIPRERTEIIPPGIEIERFKVRRKKPYVLFVGNLIKRKGLEQLIEAARELKDIKFKIVGKGPERKRLLNLAPSNVEFLGYLPEKKLLNLYSRALIFCLPSLGEGFGLVLLEAMASGCAIVSTIPMNYSGIRIPVGDVNSLKNAIEYLLQNPSLAKKMGKRNRQIAKGYSWKIFINRLIAIYEGL